MGWEAGGERWSGENGWEAVTVILGSKRVIAWKLWVWGMAVELEKWAE